MAQLIKKIFFNGKIVVKTGLHIGSTNSVMQIGGLDSAVIRNPIDNKPIIPGSSIKGKMRSLIELTDNTVGEANMKNVKNGPTKDPNSNSAKLFGYTDKDDTRPSRIIVRDSELISKDEIFSDTDLPYTESKTEVVIDRVTAGAIPRQIERVPAGAEFSLEMVLNIFDNDNEEELISDSLRALKLVQDDYIGGNGSRGYGKVEFVIKTLQEKNIDYYKGQKEPVNILEKYSKKIEELNN